ncbi:MAG: hypothetical protein HONBIEJF_01955 [Fimbriimonadaceae bacterium]|nr:hypothetical protein [Fimbriimonadaceae bacterium]
MKRLLLLLLVLAGCAKFPGEPPLTSSKRITFYLNVAGRIRDGSHIDDGGLPYVYMVAIGVSTEANPTTNGPIPVIQQPWGNGFVAGNCTHFVWYNPLDVPRYGLYRFRDANLNEYQKIGTPVVTVEPSENPNGDLRDRTIQFSIDLGQLATDQITEDQIQTLQVNFLTMDNIPQGNAGRKAWDALGDGRTASGINTWINVPVTTNGIYDYTRFPEIEPANDVASPDLDIIRWFIEVRSN